MIENLKGIHETVIYKENTHLMLYDNTQYEDYPAHWHRPVEIIMPIDGTYSVIINNTTYNLNPNEIIMIAPGVIHILKAPPTGRRIIFQVDLSPINDIFGLNSIVSFLAPASVFTKDTAPQIHEELVALINDSAKEYLGSNDLNVINRMRQESSPIVSENNLCELSIYSKVIRMFTLIGRHHLQRVQSETRSTVKQQEYIGKLMTVCDYIDTHFAEELQLDDIATMSGFSKYHFERLFKEFTNLSFYKYVNRKRISHAEQLLANNSLSITDVAIQSGFSNQSSFIRMFKIMNNCTPTDFRRMKDSSNLQKRRSKAIKHY
ncbi:MAG: helix-turn-helix domain-containing protein [Lachnospiraceae bacterium]|nr:helix-turn-helix domain-containing protein [Candidatus Colinaster scatohippi]